MNGFNATGVGKIISTAGVSKKTLYNHFTSKNELILAVLRKKDEIFRNDFMHTVESLGSNPKDQIIVIFNVLEKWFYDKDFCGCLFINAVAKFSQEEDSINAACKERKKLIYDYICKLTTTAVFKEPAELARQIHLLVEGAIVSANVSGHKNSAKRAQEMPKILLEYAQYE
ncbi:MAG: AcrR family transcriptional regulator [Lentimonas sp.]|jgi:AcrR family transcriptional regulator